MLTRIRNFRNWKTVEVILLAGIAVWLLSGFFALKTQEQLSDKVVRLHVLANSDSEEDQALKLQVRDAVIRRTAALLQETGNRQEAETALGEALPELQRLAGEQIAAAGYDYPVTVELTPTEFPTRQYEGFALPAGEYLALRVLIGEAEGQNWWCVVFPPLCAAATADVPVSALAAGLEEGEVSLITEEEGYILKFKAVEWWQHLRQQLEKRV